MSEVASSVGISSEAGLQTMLQFYHDLGIIIYYGGPGASDSSLRNTVILRPQWLVDIFRRVITIKDIDDKVRCCSVSPLEKFDSMIANLWNGAYLKEL